MSAADCALIRVAALLATFHIPTKRSETDSY